ncbi:hypothetical protein DID78_00540 [Candidatus Marinamargulisbacteria bacterium SCGC AG-343-D04]|nr:hypothetical protein DID78_00540 [Candidatus Marinamargulisbacteria bacterium SCGC AG-343-D04]
MISIQKPTLIIAKNEGAIIGGLSGFVLVNFGKNVFREHFWKESFIGILTGGISGSILYDNQFDLDPLAKGMVQAAPYTMGAGLIYGSINSLMNDGPVYDGAINGISFGAIFPGSFTGGVLGYSAGTVYSLARHAKIVEKPQVGFASAGMLLGGAGTYIYSGTITSLALVKNIKIGASFGHLTYSFWSIKKSLMTLQPGPDYKTHYEISGIARDKFTAGPALLIGFAKESYDYFLQAGNPEFRDLKNNWNGVFRQKRYF